MQRRPENQAVKAIQPLSVLPVFFDLHGKTVLVAGEGEGLEWKKELLTAAGATLRDAGVDGPFDPRSFEGVSLALGDFDCDAGANAFYNAAKGAGVPCNVIDKPAFCDFQFGSIVNRSPVVVSISTAGASPILGQAIRQRIETLLPSGIADWAAAAKTLRGELARRIPDKSARRAVWERFARAAFFRPAEEAGPLLMMSDPMKDTDSGKVTLVGAGPGDAELLTLKALRALQSADVILFDDLVSDEVLDLARREAKRLLVGKRGGRASCRQEDINNTMLKLAQQGRRVVRLKSGDPMIFGRAGEEIAFLEKAGIPVDIVPGITTALAAAAQFGVSLTHRDCAQGVKFITAHSRRGILPDLDWRACADPATTLIVYMGAKTAPELAARLIDEGLDPATPVGVAQGVARADGRAWTTCLSALLTDEIERDLPVMIGIGEVFRQARTGAMAAPAEIAA
ncbi:siroheme synthase CysG [Parvularcula sp. LCG005]|uniref:siroheme synthase CysG n=1 Tax=Parvularcula sp. LCG005 TaxID=3078805 RepID=UPI00294368D9|nr:siroheme synthase CysG [Parvularcula sp. LCG005]WOI52199.1 siroheme synthase CysG [Parvularcula sp. LCG005]